MPRNPFGERLEDARKELRDAGKPSDIPARFDAVAAEDTDGDGVPNLVEVLAGHRPGDKDDVPTKAEVAAATETMPRYRKFLASYPWRPFEVVKRPAVPMAKDAAWAANPIDAFVAAEHADRGLTPRPEADRRTLLFRVTLDPAKNPAAQYLRGTFDWHIDGCTDDIPIMATILSAHDVAPTGGETEFASSYEAYERLSPDSVRAVAFGTGFIDYESFFRGLSEGGYDGLAAYEICSPIRGGGSLENLDVSAAAYLLWMREHGYIDSSSARP